MKIAEAGQVLAGRDSTPNYAPILYISFDGMLEPLGSSQVLNYLYPLAGLGFRFFLISMEKEQDISAAAVARLVRELQECGIEWRWDLFRQGGVLEVLQNLGSVFQSARRVCRDRDIRLVHARSFLPAVIARMLQVSMGIPYIFDVRGYWIDERVAEGRWITNRVAYKLGKWVERHLVKHATAIVTLTELQAQDFRIVLPGKSSEQPIAVIPTCADYDVFHPQADYADAVPTEILDHIRGKLVIGMVGSINKSYCIRESLELFLQIQQLRPDAHLLCLTRQMEKMTALLHHHGIPTSAYTLAAVPHQKMPAWLTLIHWALLLLNADFAKRGSMPTKLAELFASQVRVIQYGCNSEVSAKVSEAGSGIVLNDLSQAELKRVAQTVACSMLASPSAVEARKFTRAYFGLESGVRKYEQLLSRVVPLVNNSKSNRSTLRQ